MNRREFMQCAAVLISGASISSLGFTMTHEQHAFLASAPNYIQKPVNFFSVDQRSTVIAISEAIIPATDTPGAIAAGVPAFIELMVSEWYNPQEQGMFMSGLNNLIKTSQEKHQKSFHVITIAEQVKLLEKLEDNASDSVWYQRGNVMRDIISDAPFICQIKELTTWGFFTSEVGGKQVLRDNPMPMRFDGEIPLKPDESSWVSTFTVS